MTLRRGIRHKNNTQTDSRKYTRHSKKIIEKLEFQLNLFSVIYLSCRFCRICHPSYIVFIASWSWAINFYNIIVDITWTFIRTIENVSWRVTATLSWTSKYNDRVTLKIWLNKYIEKSLLNYLFILFLYLCIF